MPVSEQLRQTSQNAVPSVSPFQEADAGEWDGFVNRHPHGSPFHLTAWKRTLEESYPYRPYYLTARTEGRITGALPLFLVSNFAVGKALISTPFGVYGGILAGNEESKQALYRAAIALGESLGVGYVEFRNAYPEQCGGEPNVHRYVTFSQPLSIMDSDELLTSLPKKTRNLVRKSLKTPFTARRGVRDVGRLNSIHSRNMRRLGTPAFPKRYFERLLENFGPMADVTEVWLEDELMAASLNIYHRGGMHTYHAAADTRHKDLAPNTFLYFDHLLWASANGFSEFDFGRSKREAGTFAFKSHWNTTMRELPYEIALVRRKTLPDFTPASPRFHLAINIWRRLPLWLTRLLGPRLITLFP